MKMWQVEGRVNQPQSYYEGMVGSEVETYTDKFGTNWIKLRITYQNEQLQMVTEGIWFDKEDLSEDVLI